MSDSDIFLENKFSFIFIKKINWIFHCLGRPNKRKWWLESTTGSHLVQPAVWRVGPFAKPNREVLCYQGAKLVAQEHKCESLRWLEVEYTWIQMPLRNTQNQRTQNPSILTIFSHPLPCDLLSRLWGLYLLWHQLNLHKNLWKDQEAMKKVRVK